MIYKPSQVLLTIDGVIITNWESATADYKEDAAETDAGSDGKVTNIVNESREAVAELTLKQTCAQLPFIRGLLNARSQIPFALLNKSDGSEAVAGPSCMVAKAPINLAKALSSNVIKIIGEMLII